MMTKEQIKSLIRGDIVRYRNGDSYIVIGQIDSEHKLAIREITVSDGHEWTLVKQHDWTKDETK
jgi:hypothetical protein